MIVLNSINGWNGTKWSNEVVLVVAKILSDVDGAQNDGLLNELT